MRDEPWLAGQNLADRADQTGNVLDTIQYFVVLIAEDDVAVLSHDFDDQLFAAQITQLIQVFQFKNDDSFQTRLGNGDDTRILNHAFEAAYRNLARSWGLVYCRASDR